MAEEEGRLGDACRTATQLAEDYRSQNFYLSDVGLLKIVHKSFPDVDMDAVVSFCAETRLIDGKRIKKERLPWQE